jgi:hypothetical protein
MTTSKTQSTLHLTLITVLIFSMLAACGGGGTSAPEDAGPTKEPPVVDQVGEVDQDLPENVHFWGFDGGQPSDWEVSPGWQFEGGSATSVGPDQAMFTFEQWANFNLFTRIETGPETAFGIFIRAAEDARYQIIFEPGAFVFFWHIGNVVDEVVLPGYNLEPGWHELHIQAAGSTITISVDGEGMFDLDNLQHTLQGTIGFLNHTENPLSIDYVEVHRLDEGMEGVASDEPIPEPGFEPAPDFVLHEPPIASLIAIGEPSDNFQVTITGGAGAAEPGSLVSVANLATSRVDFTDAREDGSFQLDVFAFPGTSLQIKHATVDFYNEEERI